MKLIYESNRIAVRVYKLKEKLDRTLNMTLYDWIKHTKKHQKNQS